MSTLYNRSVSAFNDLDLACPDCGEEFRGTVWTAIHAQQDPELKELLLGGEMNLLACSHCGKTNFFENFLLYQDPALDLVAYVYPQADEAREAELRPLMEQGFKEVQETFPLKERFRRPPQLFFGLAALVEVIRAEEREALQKEVEAARLKETT